MPLALDPLLLAIDCRFDPAGGTRIFPGHLAESSAGGFFFLQSCKRLSKPQQSVGRLCRFIELGGDAEESFRGISVLLALEIALAKPVLRVRDQGIARILLREVAHGFLGQRVVFSLHVADAEVEFVLWRGRRRQGRKPRAGSRRSRSCRDGGRIDGRSRVREIKRLAGSAATGSADRSLRRNREL